MTPFTTHNGIVALLKRDNIDTDAIIPKQFLKSIHRTGYGPNAFFDWRYQNDGRPNPEFEPDKERFKGRSILVTGNNFGCGSSREHAVWALVQDGYKAIVAPSKQVGGEFLPAFADIFRNNALKNGLLTIELTPDEVNSIIDLVNSHEGVTADIDLPGQTFTLNGPTPKTFSFEIAAGAKKQLVEGLDDIDLTLQYETDIASFEKNSKNDYFAST